MRIAFLGNDPRSVPSLRAVARSAHDLGLVVTRDARPAGRKGELRRTAVAEAAEPLGLPLLETPTVKRGAGLERLRQTAPDVMVVVAYGEILPADVLAIPRLAPVNVHFSLLPKLRGADPVRRAILDGLSETGVTTMRMDEGLDTGPILLQAAERIRDDDDAATLGDRLAERGADLLVATLDGLERGDVEERPQDDSEATLAPKVRAEEAVIDWTLPAVDLHRRVRALSPEPGARTTFRGRGVKVTRTEPVDVPGAPGAVVEASNRRLVVAAGKGGLELVDVVPEGRRPMSGAEFARGQRPTPDDRFG